MIYHFRMSGCPTPNESLLAQRDDRVQFLSVTRSVRVIGDPLLTHKATMKAADDIDG